MILYTVEVGDNLTFIARRYGVPLNKLIAANPQISNPNLIYPGQSINVPIEAAPTMADIEDIIPEPSQKRFVKGKHGRYHKLDSFFIAGQDGTKEQPLSEPVPTYFARPGDGILRANSFEAGTHDNNTMIVFGRDRTGQGEIDSSDTGLKKSSSGYSRYMGAGAIDIVVGRCSPFPVSIRGKTWSPSFNTKTDVDELKLETLQGKDPEDQGKDFSTTHPAVIMDAARIYISQMTDIDENFKIQKRLFVGSTIREDLSKRMPCSGIMLKADKIRMHARQDIKLVTKGPHETINSQGNDITQTGGCGIHLIANNEPSNQQPIPLGDNLATMLDDLINRVDQLAGIVFNFTASQMKYNSVLGMHTHHGPFMGLSDAPSLTVLPKSVETVLDQFTKTQTQILSLKNNLGSFKLKYLKNGAGNYINSKYNTTN